MVFPTSLWILLVVCLVLSSIGFYKFVYFLSVGYGFAVSGVGLAILVLYGSSLSIWTIAICALFIIYGIRLGGFLVLREIKSGSYRKVLAEATGSGKKIPVFVKATIWICVSCMYVMQVSPVLYRAVNGDNGNNFAMASAIIMALAIIIETISDKQKSAAKKINPKRFCDTGLFKIVRCPNYLGEILFWLGVFVSSFGSLNSIGQWLVSSIGFVLIVYVMLSGAKRLELRQNNSYGKDPEYIAYVNKTPIIFPLIPLKSLAKIKFIVT